MMLGGAVDVDHGPVSQGTDVQHGFANKARPCVGKRNVSRLRQGTTACQASFHELPFLFIDIIRILCTIQNNETAKSIY